MKKLGFTLVELIVGITISMLLMVSVGVFVSTGMSNITLQKKVLDDNKKISSDILYLQKNVLNSSEFIKEFSSGVLLRQNKYFDKGGFSYIGVKEFDNFFYCGTGDVDKTNHLYIENFIPLSGVNTGTTNYKSDTKKHQILKKNGGDWGVVVGKDIFGNKFKGNGVSGTGVFLNSPTGVVEVDGKLIFSDTLNDRILYLSGSEVYKMLNDRDGLEEPIGLAYNSTEKVLYIANAGKGEILKLSSENKTTNPNLVINFTPKNNFSANKIKIDLLNTTENFTNPDDKNDFTFTYFSNSSQDYVKTENQRISYYFINSYGTEQREDDCYGKVGDFIIDLNDNVIKCTDSGNMGPPTFQNTGTGKLAHFTSKDFYSGTNYKIEVSDILPNLSDKKNYYIKLNFLNDNNLKYSEYFPYFTQGDDDIFTKNDNTLEIKQSGLNYPTGVDNSGNATEFDSNTFNPDNYEKDFIFSNPIKSLDKNYSSNLLNLKLNYYKYLNCFNEDEKIERNFLIKKNY